MIEYWLVHFLLSLFSAADSPLHWPKLPPPHPQSLHSPKNLHLHHPPPFVCVSSSPLPYPAWGERAVLIQAGGEGGAGGGELAFRSPSFMPGTPGPSTWQCDNVAGLFKRDPVFVKCFSPWRATTGQGQGTWKVPEKEEGQLWSHNVKGMDFLINLSRESFALLLWV